MKYLELTVQTLFAIALVIVLSRIAHGEEIALLLALQFIVGIWQMLVSVISVLRTGSESPRRKHLEYSTIYITVLILSMMAFSSVVNMISINDEYLDILGRVGLGFLLGPPWILAIYHYTISWKLAFNRHKKSSSFLPHINF
jgi:hypothetical protein